MLAVGRLQAILFFVFFFAIFLVSAWALVDAVRRPARAFVAQGKKTKTFWSTILGIAAVASFIAVPFPGGFYIGGVFTWLALAAAVAALVYLFDVRPAVAPYSRRPGGSSRS
ncbi:MAG: DUF2516 family protein [Micrococcales bacterium]|nr:DUF2516 family protein [Micrococcales bacterium]